MFKMRSALLGSTYSIDRAGTKFASNWFRGGSPGGSGGSNTQTQQKPPQNNQQGGNQQTNQQQKTDGSQGGNNDNNNNNNKSDNIDPNDKMVDDIWNEMKKDDTKNGGVDPTKQQNGPNNQQQQQQDPKAELKSYLDGVGLGDFTLTDAQKEQIKSGEGLDAIFADINGRIQLSHTKALSGASALIDKKVKDAVAQAVGESRSYVKGEQLRSELHASLPYTKDPIIGPVAETVYKRILEKGATVPDAIKAVDKFFERVAKTRDPDYVEPNSNTRNSFRGGSSQMKEGPAGENEGWLDVLRSKQQS